MMDYQKPRKDGYYWYAEVAEVDGRGSPTKFVDWDIVKLEWFGTGHYKNNPLRMKKPILMMADFNCHIKGLRKVNKSKGVWGKRIAMLNLRDQERR